MLRILIADDHPVFRYGLKAILATDESLSVVGEAATGAEAVEKCRQLNPDVVIMDVNMPVFNGVEATRQIIAIQPDVAVLVVTMLEDETVAAAVKAGARGYLVKGSDGDVTLRAVHAVAAGEAIFSPGSAERLFQSLGQPAKPAIDPLLADLTNREREILELMAQGLTNTAMAERLFLSPKTIRNQVSEIYSKLGVDNRGAAIVKARGAGLGHD
jgi:DNA-binding NarL/FixJ family response regulator